MQNRHFPAALADAAGRGFSLFFPEVCPACLRRAAKFGSACCNHCSTRLGELPIPRCRGCGGAVDGPLELCGECLAGDERPWRLAVSAYGFSGYLRELVHRFKYRGATALTSMFANAMAANWRRHAETVQVDAVVPMPMHPWKEFARGYNQACLLAERVADELDLPIGHDLRRRRWSRSQTQLDFAARRGNVRDLFEVSSRNRVEGVHILLVDDVLTTGATLEAATRVLLAAGAASVGVLTLARG